MADLETSKKVRTAAKTRLTVASKKLASLTEEVEKQELILAIDDFEEKLKSYDDSQRDVESWVPEGEMEAEVTSSETYRAEKLPALAKGRALLELKSMAETIHVGPPSSVPAESSHGRQQVHAKLPRLELQPFGGDYTEWQSFWDKFEAIVHKTEVPVISKFSYLQSLLKDEALTAIAGLSLTEANYEAARTLLQERFGRPERIIFSHIQGLLNLPTPGKSTEQLWSLYDSLQAHIRSLEALDIGGETFGVILTPLVLHKLPENIRLEWARDGDGKEKDLAALLKFMHTEIVRRERSQTFRGKKEDAQDVDSRRLPRNRRSTNHQLLARSSNCNVCGKTGHPTAKCFGWKKLSPERKKDTVFTKGLCFTCLETGHRSTACKGKEHCQCPVLPGRHHPLLCGKKGASETYDHQKQKDSSSTVLTTSSDSPRHYSLLQMASTTAEDKRGKRQCLNLLFDTGADRSYISSSAVKALGLTCISREKVSVALFGQSKPNEARFQNKFKLKLFCHDDVSVEEVIVTEAPVISVPVFRPPLPNSLLRKIENKGITLSPGSVVPCDSHLQIDILIGFDFFLEISTTKGLQDNRTFVGTGIQIWLDTFWLMV